DFIEVNTTFPTGEQTSTIYNPIESSSDFQTYENTTVDSGSLKLKIKWWNSSFQKCQDITISSPVNDYQYKLVLNTTNFDYSYASDDGSDIRIVNSSCGNGGVEVPYWIEKWNESGDSIIWFRGDNSSTTTYAIYYNYTQAEPKSNGDKTFIFFDDFEGTSLDTTKWDDLSAGSGYAEIVSGRLHLRGYSNYQYGKIQTKNNLGINYDCIIEMEVEPINPGSPSGVYGIPNLYDSSENRYVGNSWASWLSNELRLLNGTTTHYFNWNAGNNYPIKAVCYTSLKKWDYYLNGELKAQNYSSNSASFSGTIDILRLSTGASDNGGEAYYDNLRIRKYTSPEPTLTVSSPETIDSKNWWNTSFPKCRNINIMSIASSALINFPAYINVTYDSDMQSDYDDIRFVDKPCGEGGTQLNYEIEYYDSSHADIWVKIDSLPSSGKTIAMYYGNPTVSSVENKTGVWDNNFKLVWHLSENPSDGYVNDSTSYGHLGTIHGSMTSSDSVSCKAGNCFDFDGVNDYINTPDDANLKPADVTLEFWVYPRETNPDSRWFVGKGCTDKWGNKDAVSYGINLRDLEGDDSTDIFTRPERNDNTQTRVTDYNVSINKWYYVVMTFNTSDNNVSLYVSGSYIGSADHGQDLRYSGPWDFLVAASHAGTGSGVNRYENCRIDEVRVSNMSRSADWINQTYQLIENQNNYVNFGNEKSLTDLKYFPSGYVFPNLTYSNNITKATLWANDTNYTTKTFSDTFNDYSKLLEYNNIKIENGDMSLFKTSNDWWNSSFHKCQNITISSPVNDYQYKLILNTTNFNYSYANDDGSDIRIVNASCGNGGQELPYWIEKWNKTGESTIWFRGGNSSTTTYAIYYNYTQAEPKSNGTKTWNFFDDFTTDTTGEYTLRVDPDHSDWYLYTRPSWASASKRVRYEVSIYDLSCTSNYGSGIDIGTSADYDSYGDNTRNKIWGGTFTVDTDSSYCESFKFLTDANESSETGINEVNYTADS
ncbi:MAG: DUF2341 domain-containing protein, partial [Candidatus Aenigmarchaeota archaeon]|nr:DUF2341 domain-containing protein [Candidatus Aenigmarchaeota archaeon]